MSSSPRSSPALSLPFAGVCLAVICLVQAVYGQAAMAQAGTPAPANVPDRGDLPPRSAAYMDDLVLMANLLGSAHAVRQVCDSTQAQQWRRRMVGLLDLEAPEPGRLRQRLIQTFNAAYARINARYPACSPDARGAERAFAEQGRKIADRLAAAYLPPPPQEDTRNGFGRSLD